MSVTVSGGLRKLEPEKLASSMQKSLDAVGILLEGEVISRANENVDTGRHKGSVTWRTKRSGTAIQHPATEEDKQSDPTERFEVHVGTAVHYAPHLEYGHKTKGGGHTKAYPHFRSAFDANKARAVKIFHKYFNKFIGSST
jgi:hypothetical protein